MATAKQTTEYELVSVEMWKCSDCKAIFPAIGAPQYCPECGEEFERIDSTLKEV